MKLLITWNGIRMSKGGGSTPTCVFAHLCVCTIVQRPGALCSPILAMPHAVVLEQESLYVYICKGLHIFWELQLHCLFDCCVSYVHCVSCLELHWSCCSDLEELLWPCGMGWVKISKSPARIGPQTLMSTPKMTKSLKSVTISFEQVRTRELYSRAHVMTR